MVRRPPGGAPSRSRNQQPERRVIKIVSEGRVTEPEYLNIWAHRNRSTVRVEFDTTHGDPLTLVRRAVRLEKASQRNARRKGGAPDHDEIWCMFDVDEHPHLTEALLLARDRGICVAMTNPCFELWLALHWDDQTAAVHRHDSQRRAGELGICDGKHLAQSIASELISRYDDAKARAQGLDAWHEGNGSTPGHNPSSSVWRLVDAIRRSE